MADNVTSPVPNGTVLAADDVGGVLFPRTKIAHGPDGSAVDVSSASPLPVAVNGVATETTLAAVLAKIIAAPATDARLESVRALLAGTLAVSAAALPLPAGAATSANQSTQTSAINVIGTRAYGIPIARLAVGSASAKSVAIVATEIMVHASVRCFIAVGAEPTATTDYIPLEAGEKFHLRITSGHKVAVLRDTVDGFLNVIPVI